MPAEQTTFATTTSARVYGGKSAGERTSERVDRLLTAALELFGTHGYAATSIEQLCTRASVSTRSFYQDVGGRAALLQALVARLNDAGALAAGRALTEKPDAPVIDRISLAIRAYLAETCATRQCARVCYVEVVGVSSEIEQWRHSVRENIVVMFDTEGSLAVERNELEPRNFRLLILAVIGAANILAQEWAMSTPNERGDDRGFDPFIDEIVQIASAALKH
ncbi:AcrR family transcriptional regulator [Rhodococcus sp. 27YEA15]|uniref:TetR/AcrR family transcriptional regulator n=1 Tax=Rhodococcus sp. 27YEA15 TaxID=3156259 RepID=UPI003C7C5748